MVAALVLRSRINLLWRSHSEFPLSKPEFVRTHVRFLKSYPQLKATIELVSHKPFTFLPETDLDRINTLPENDPECVELKSILLRKQIAYYLSHVAIQDIYDIILLAANGKGSGALKIVRGMYEHLVTARFIALKPTEARPFVDDFELRGWTLINHWYKNMPEFVLSHLTKDEIKRFEDQAKIIQAERNKSICKKCGQPEPDANWTKTNLYDMAQQVGQGLDVLYTECYRIPSAYHHATALGLQFKATSSGDLSAGRRDAALSVVLGQQLLLNALEFQNEYFDLGLTDKITACVQQFADAVQEHLQNRNLL